MPAITMREIEASYDLAKQVYENQKPFEDAVGSLVDDYQMNETSANISITYFQHFIEGKRYGRALNIDHTRYYIENVLQDYGVDKFKDFLKGLEKHIEYRGELGHSVRTLRRMHNEFSEQNGMTPIYQPNPPHKRIGGESISPQQESIIGKLLKDVWHIPNTDNYKIHFARKNDAGVNPLDVCVHSFHEWEGWQEHYPSANHFNKTYIFSLMDFYPEDDTWLFGGVWEINHLELNPKYETGGKYQVNLTNQGKEYIGRLKLHLRYTNKQGRVYMEPSYSKFIVKEILNEPYFKIPINAVGKFDWVPFYEKFATELLKYENRRTELAKTVCTIASNEADTFTIRQGDHEPSDDIDPFTVFSFFTQGDESHKGNITKRQNTIAELCKFLAIFDPKLEYYDGLPTNSSRNRIFFAPPGKRNENDISKLWSFFMLAMDFADSKGQVSEAMFVEKFNETMEINMVGDSAITKGLFWIRPNFFPTLETNTLQFIKDNFGIEYKNSGENYLSVRQQLLKIFEEGDEFEITSFPELADAAYQYMKNSKEESDVKPASSGEARSQLESEERSVYREYTTLHIREDDGCFISKAELDQMLERLKKKQNLILQGPPGTGKTWLAKRLAFALIGKKDRSKIEAVQFHPNMSYEDFVMGYRPSDSDNDKPLEREDGIFLKLCEKARANMNEKYVVIIEEINRGNPAQIFGELLTLLESDKRNLDEALRLSYQKEGEEKFYIPENLYVIGTMNLADRSLAIVDIALRRRFAFENLKPLLNDKWLEVCQKHGITDENMLRQIRTNIEAVNNSIANDTGLGLGEQFCIGHSFVTPDDTVKNAVEWYKEIVRTEIVPLLEEYWFDSPVDGDDNAEGKTKTKVQAAKEELLRNI